ncbi:MULTISPECIES: cupin domain-containing protein [unclassified Knoellia]|uniref:cupin domain-containing protein n=1 Tax=unclassified Knoellia TaxID=2618719 RepID=UPI0023DAD69C|nr:MULTISPECIES: cupin domain-containing protein [unclassified Knoellia]MDF2092204.1 cupin domain-containing protein [Knoellia sp. 3-2P3]MDF2143486.1 cupin domain-containing protein [Knoellia sp. p5-6-4]
MGGLESRSFDSPEEVRPFTDKGAAEVVTLAGSTVLKGRFEPGWRWSEHVRPLAGTDSCQSPHLLYVLSGRMHLRMNDGTEGEAGPNEVVRAEPGHDAWVVGDEPCVVVDFGASPSYARPA